MTEELKANRKWEAKNPDKTKHDTARRQARRYIRDFATEEDISEVKAWLELVEQGKMRKLND